MDPNNMKPGDAMKSSSSPNPAFDDLAKEGIDVVSESTGNIENGFSISEAETAASDLAIELEKGTPKPVQSQSEAASMLKKTLAQSRETPVPPAITSSQPTSSPIPKPATSPVPPQFSMATPKPVASSVPNPLSSTPVSNVAQVPKRLSFGVADAMPKNPEAAAPEKTASPATSISSSIPPQFTTPASKPATSPVPPQFSAPAAKQESKPTTPPQFTTPAPISTPTPKPASNPFTASAATTAPKPPTPPQFTTPAPTPAAPLVSSTPRPPSTPIYAAPGPRPVPPQFTTPAPKPETSPFAPPVKPPSPFDRPNSAATPPKPQTPPVPRYEETRPIPPFQSLAMSPEVSNQAIKNDPSIKPLRTFKTDAEEAVRYQNVSAIDIAVAEQKKKEEKQAVPVEYADEKKPRKGILFTTLIILTIAIAGAGFYIWKTKTPLSVETPVLPTNAPQQPTTEITVETIIPYQNGDTVLLSNETDPFTLIANRLSQTSADDGEVYVLVPIIGTTSTSIAPVADVFTQTSIPAMLERSLGPDYMIGSYKHERTSPFVILTNTFFQNAFAGMLEWEKDLRNDFIALIKIDHPNESVVATDSDVFEDSIVSNTDTRVLRAEDGTIILAYAFFDTRTTIIATSIEALKHALDRLMSVRTIQ